MTSFSYASASTIFFFQAEDGIRDGVQTCALPISVGPCARWWRADARWQSRSCRPSGCRGSIESRPQIGRASCRERVEISVAAASEKQKIEQRDETTTKVTPLADAKTNSNRPMYDM